MPDNNLRTDLNEATRVLVDGCQRLQICLSQDQIESFLSYISLILVWNKTFNLTAIRDPVAIVRLHFLDSLAISAFIIREGPLMDMGSGAGFPGLPLSIVHPELPVILVEPRRKRANFLRAVIRAIKLPQVMVREERVESLDPSTTGMFSTVVLRAVGQPEFFLEHAKNFLVSGGRCVILQGPNVVAAFDRIKVVYSSLGYKDLNLYRYRIPPLGEERSVICVAV